MSTLERWIYLGKEVGAYRRTRQRLRAENEWSYEELLQEKAEGLRRPFLDFVARIGAKQKDPVTWWSTRFSWKLWTASDLFLLTCYLAVAEEVIAQAQTKGAALRVVVEDPWLLRQIRENIASHPRVRLQGPMLLGFRTRQIALGLARRGRWLIAMIRSRLRQKKFWPQQTLPVPQTPTAGIFSYPSKSAFERPGAWQDSHLPGLDRFLAESGCEIARFTPPECTGWEQEIAERSSTTYPLILWATGRRLLKSLAVFWRPRWPETLELEGRSIRWLCLREGWLEVGRSSLCAYRLFYECLQGMLSQGNWRSLVTFYENQPWEKLQVLAGRSKGVRTVGIQTNLLSRFYLSYGLGRAEQDHPPLPDRIGCSGPAMHQLLMECGVSPASLILCGALRYPDLLERFSRNEPHQVSAEGRCRVLVVLPIDPVLARQLLEALRRAFPDGGEEAGLHFVIRAHPVYPIPKRWVEFPATWSETTFTNLQAQMSSCLIVLFTASTVGFEALAAGKRVIRYRSPRLFDLDEPYGMHLPVVSDANLRAELLAHRDPRHAARSPKEMEQLIRSVFQAVDPDRLLDLFRDTMTSPTSQKESHLLAESAAKR